MTDPYLISIYFLVHLVFLYVNGLYLGSVTKLSGGFIGLLIATAQVVFTIVIIVLLETKNDRGLEYAAWYMLIVSGLLFMALGSLYTTQVLRKG